MVEAELRSLSKEASKYMNYGEHSYKDLCKTKLFKKAKDLLLVYWRAEYAKMACDAESLILNNKHIYWCEECGEIQPINFMTIHHNDYNWEFIFDPTDIDPMCISCHKKIHGIEK